PPACRGLWYWLEGYVPSSVKLKPIPLLVRCFVIHPRPNFPSIEGIPAVVVEDPTGKAVHEVVTVRSPHLLPFECAITVIDLHVIGVALVPSVLRRPIQTIAVRINERGTTVLI